MPALVIQKIKKKVHNRAINKNEPGGDRRKCMGGNKV